MSHRNAKKARQLYRRGVRNEAEELGQMLGNAMKPKPRFVPWWLWMLFVRLVIKIK